MKLAFLFLCLGAELFASQDEPFVLRNDVLDRGFESLERGPLTVRRAFVSALGAGYLPGGIEITEDCATQWVRIWPRDRTTVREAMNDILAARPDLVLDVSKEGAVHIRPRTTEGGVLDVVLSSVDIPDARDVRLPLNQLTESPEFQMRIKQLGLKEGRVHLGMSPMPSPGLPAPPPIPLKLSKITVRDALNRLATLKGSAVWVYHEMACSGERVFTLTFDRR